MLGEITNPYLDHSIATVDGVVDGIAADVGAFPTANYASLAAYVEDIRSRLTTIDDFVDDLEADMGTFPTANYATIAAYVENIRTRLITIDDFVDEVESLLKNATYGLSALDTDLGTVLTRIGTPATSLKVDHDDIDTGIADLITRTKGLNDIHDDVAAISPGVPASVFPSADVEKLDDISGGLAPSVGGTMANPSNVVDGNTGTWARADAVGEYVELTFKTPVILIGYRVYKMDTPYAPTSRLKIEYYDGAAWHDWKTGIVNEDTEGWTAWNFPDMVLVKGKKVRITATALDGQGYAYLQEIELYGLCAYCE